MNDQIRIVWYYVVTSSSRTLLLLLVCIGLSAALIYKTRTEKYWESHAYTFSVGQTAACMLLTAVMIYTIGTVSESLNPKGLALTDIVKSSCSYIPDIDQLCDNEGNRRFKTYDEYREWYVSYRYGIESK